MAPNATARRSIEHDQIVKALSSQDLNRAADAMGTHLLSIKRTTMAAKDQPAGDMRDAEGKRITVSKD